MFEHKIFSVRLRIRVPHSIRHAKSWFWRWRFHSSSFFYPNNLFHHKFYKLVLYLASLYFLYTFWFGHSHFSMTFPMRSSQSHVLNSLTVRPREKTKSHSLRHFTSHTCLEKTKPKNKIINFFWHFQFSHVTCFSTLFGSAWVGWIGLEWQSFHSHLSH